MFKNKRVMAMIAIVACLAMADIVTGCSSADKDSAKDAYDMGGAKSSSVEREAKNLSLDPNSHAGAPQEKADNTSNTTNASNGSDSSSNSKGYIDSVGPDDPYGSGIHHVQVAVAGYSPFTIGLDADSAPVSVSNFCNLVSQGYYDGLTFYRFQDGFCMQGGTMGNSASGQDSSISNILGEFSENDVDNQLADNFKRGVVAMARSTDPNSASSTFFVTLGDGTSVGASLNGKYAAFGTIDSAGMDIVDQIVADHAAAAASDSMGMVSNEDEQATITSITILD